MTEIPELSIHEKTFAKSDKTDAILVVDGNKLHVNKALFSYHSDYFNALFNSDFKEKSMEEIEIKDVKFEEFATVLSLVHCAPIKHSVDKEQVNSLLEIADRFQLTGPKRHLELFLMISANSSDTLIRIADKYQLNDLMDITLSKYQLDEYWYRNRVTLDTQFKRELYKNLSDETNIKLFHRFLEIQQKITKKPKLEIPTISIYEKAFAKSEKTDAVLVVEGKKLHVNKAVLSYHSDYFNALFNSNFKEKSMEEIPIEDINFENFATLLSLIHLNPIAPTIKNALNILELSDRFIVPCVRYFLEPIIISSQLASLEKILIGEKYGMSELFQKGINTFTYHDFMDLPSNPTYQALSSVTKRKLFEKSLGFI